MRRFPSTFLTSSNNESQFISFLDFWVLHAVILVSFELLPFSFKFVGNSSLSSSCIGGGWGVVVVVMALVMKVLELFSCWCLFGVYLYQETEDNFWLGVCLRRCLSLLNLTCLYPATYLLNRYLLNFHSNFSFFCIYVNEFLGSTVSDV